jgi:glucan phosphorylase
MTAIAAAHQAPTFAGRIHEYKRQLLNVLDLIRVDQAIADGAAVLPSPRVCIFAGKAAPTYFIGKRVNFASYGQALDRAAAAYVDRERWLRMAIRNTARAGSFSSDRAIREYASDIWNITAR